MSTGLRFDDLPNRRPGSQSICAHNRIEDDNRGHMLLDTSYATMPLAPPVANAIAPASVRLRQLHTRTWTGVSAELFEMHAVECGLVELPPGRMRLLIVLN